jgi:hypothetical protein
MSETKTVETVLARLQAPTRTRSKKWATVESNLQYIIDARRRRASFRAIAEALGEVGIEVNPETLRLFVTKHPRYRESLPKASELSNTFPKNRRGTNRVAKARKIEKSLQDVSEKQAESKTEPLTVAAAVVSSPPKPVAKPIMKPNDFAGIRRLNARK